MTGDRRRELEVAMELAAEAGRRIMAHRRDGVEAQHKRSGELVTAADRDASRIVTAGLTAAWPEDALLCEELAHRPAPTQGRCWIVDPLDGTRAYLRGDDDFAVLICLIEGGRPRVGVVYEPVTGRADVAVAGQGAWTGDVEGGPAGLAPLVRAPVPEGRLVLAVGRPYKGPPVETLRDGFAVTGLAKAGAVGLRLAWIARGIADVYVNPGRGARQWDTAAGTLLITETGGRVTDLRGEPLAYADGGARHADGLLAAATPALHARVLAGWQALTAGS